jgi:hypothetical protein
VPIIFHPQYLLAAKYLTILVNRLIIKTQHQEDAATLAEL